METQGPLKDVIAYGLKIIFIGFNPGLRSGEIGHHYAGHSNRFWRLVFEAGLIPRRLRAEDDEEMLAFGYGLTNIVARISRTAAEITVQEYEQGRTRLRALIEEYRPRIAAYNGIEVYRKYSGRRDARPGLQPVPVVPGVRDFVLFSPSGLVRTPYPEMLQLYRELNALAQEEPNRG